MTKLDELIAQQAYILDCLLALRNIQSGGCCNVCLKKRNCEFSPKPGQLVRYNCPFYEEENDECK